MMAIFYGSAGRDDFESTPDDDTYFGYEGDDSVYYSSNFLPGAYEPDFGLWGVGITANLEDGTGTDGFGSTETYDSIEQIYGTIFDDVVIGSEYDNYFLLRGGADYYDGGSGSDTIAFQTEWTGSGIFVNLDQEYGYDTFGNYETIISIENVRGSPQNDTIIGSASDGFMMGLDGDDYLDGAGGTDTVRYDRDVQYYNPNTGSNGTSGVDVDLTAGIATDGYGDTDTILNFENVVATRFNDVITGDEDNNALWGVAGEDTIAGGGGDDDLWGDLGDNRHAGSGFTDCFVFEAQNGRDIVHDFEAGIDKLDLSAFADVVLLAGRPRPAQIPDVAISKLTSTPAVETGFTLFDTNSDGMLDENDAALELVNGGQDALIDLGAVYSDVTGEDTILLIGVTELSADDFIF